MGYIVLACIVMAYIVMACIVMAYIIMAYIVMANAGLCGAVSTKLGELVTVGAVASFVPQLYRP